MTEQYSVVAALLQAVEGAGVPAAARPVSVESDPHDDLPDRAMTIIEFDTGDLVGLTHPAVLTEGERWALLALLHCRAAVSVTVYDLA